jgi:hypothetical protein
MSGDAGLLEAMGVEIVLGRGLNPTDAGTHNVVLTESLGRTLWPGQNPVGRTLSQFVNGQWGRSDVGGIARDFAYHSLMDAPAGVIIGGSPSMGTGADIYARDLPTS